MGSRLLRLAIWIYMIGYAVYVASAGIRAWPKMTWLEWLTDVTWQVGWYGPLWPFYFGNLITYVQG